jgi:hypothetical protein
MFSSLSYVFSVRANDGQTQTEMEEWAIGNVRQAIEKGTLKSIVPEQVDL